VKPLPLLLTAFFVSCAPAYSVTKPTSTTPVEVTGVYIGVFFGAGDLDGQLLNALPSALTSAGFKVTGVKYPAPKGASVKLEGEISPASSSDPRPSKIAKAVIRVIDFKTAKVVAQYRFETGNPIEMRDPGALAGDIAGLIGRDFKQLP
jgi:hypothetical protein